MHPVPLRLAGKASAYSLLCSRHTPGFSRCLLRHVTTPDAAMAAPRIMIVTPITKQTATVIFVHGLGESSEGWKSVVQMLQESTELNHVKWMLPDV